uniref:Uncharacterized protein n=1 Tax=Odontella aurita TaxID=265563 RepID=A0A7S4IME0_9STRA|mmetsp:Transcript_27359/g.80514  ORF Transcript_27359/g.80514 Transcript_27359/m.80514 type:complete len:853 (+) Transcript_27359:412-2970(+)
MRAKVKQHASLLLLAATSTLVIGIAGQDRILTGEQQARLQENLNKKFLSTQKAVRKNGIAAVLPRYRQWVAEQQVQGAVVQDDPNVPPDNSGGGQKSAQHAGRRKKGWRKRMRRKKRRRKRRGAGFRGRKRNANQNRAGEESHSVRSLQGRKRTNGTGQWRVEGEDEDEDEGEGDGAADMLKLDVPDSRRQPKLLRGVQNDQTGGVEEEGITKAWSGNRIQPDWLAGKDHLGIGMLQENDEVVTPPSGLTGRRTQLDQDALVALLSELSIGLTAIISAKSPGFTRDFHPGEEGPKPEGSNDQLLCAGVDPKLWEPNIFTPRRPRPPEVVLVDCFDTAADFWIWELEPHHSANNLETFEAFDVHLSFLNTRTEIDTGTNTAKNIQQFNVWMSRDEIAENELVRTDRTDIFDMGPVDPLPWLFLPGPNGDRTWRPYPQGETIDNPRYPLQQPAAASFLPRPVERQLCATAQKKDGLVGLGSRVKLEECTDKGGERQRQAWIYCGVAASFIVRPVDVPSFSVSAEQSGVTIMNFLNRKVTENNFNDNQSEGGCVSIEDDLNNRASVQRWTDSFTMGELGFANTYFDTLIDWEVTLNCDTRDSDDVDYDMIFQLYRQVGNSNNWQCIRSMQLICKTRNVVVRRNLDNIQIFDDSTYHIVARGASRRIIGNGIIDVPSFDTVIEAIVKPTVTQLETNKKVTDSPNFDPNQAVTRCSENEGDLKRGNDVESWRGQPLTLAKLSISKVASTSVKIEITLNCDTEDSEDFKLDTLFQLYRKSGGSNSWDCLGSKILECRARNQKLTHSFVTYALIENSEFHVVARGATEAGDVVLTNSNNQGAVECEGVTDDIRFTTFGN